MVSRKDTTLEIAIIAADVIQLAKAYNRYDYKGVKKNIKQIRGRLEKLGNRI